MHQQRPHDESFRWIDRLSRRQALKITGSGAAVIAAGRLAGRVSPVNAQQATPVAATPTGCPELSLDEMKALAAAFFPAWEGVVQDPSALAALFSPDYIHHWGLGPDSIGIDDSIARITTYMQAIPDQHFTVEAVYGEGDVIIVRWTASGTQTGDLGVIAASNTSADFSGVNIFRFECGLIAESWNETDQLGRLMQNGVITEDELGSVGTPTP
jgi:predicted ester cyclase